MMKRLLLFFLLNFALEFCNVSLVVSEQSVSHCECDQQCKMVTEGVLHCKRLDNCWIDGDCIANGTFNVTTMSFSDVDRVQVNIQQLKEFNIKSLILDNVQLSNDSRSSAVCDEMCAEKVWLYKSTTLLPGCDNETVSLDNCSTDSDDHLIIILACSAVVLVILVIVCILYQRRHRRSYFVNKDSAFITLFNPAVKESVKSLSSTSSSNPPSRESTLKRASVLFSASPGRKASEKDHPVFSSSDVVPDSVLEHLGKYLLTTNIRRNMMIMLDCRSDFHVIESIKAADADKGYTCLNMWKLKSGGEYRKLAKSFRSLHLAEPLEVLIEAFTETFKFGTGDGEEDDLDGNVFPAATDNDFDFVGKVLTIKPYKSKTPGELSFPKNEIIHVLSWGSAGWSTGKLVTGSEGTFPDEYTVKLPSEELQMRQTRSFSLASTIANPYTSMDGQDNFISNKQAAAEPMYSVANPLNRSTQASKKEQDASHRYSSEGPVPNTESSTHPDYMLANPYRLSEVASAESPHSMNESPQYAVIRSSDAMRLFEDDENVITAGGYEVIRRKSTSSEDEKKGSDSSLGGGYERVKLWKDVGGRKPNESLPAISSTPQRQSKVLHDPDDPRYAISLKRARSAHSINDRRPTVDERTAKFQRSRSTRTNSQNRRLSPNDTELWEDSDQGYALLKPNQSSDIKRAADQQAKSQSRVSTVLHDPKNPLYAISLKRAHSAYDSGQRQPLVDKSSAHFQRSKSAKIRNRDESPPPPVPPLCFKSIEESKPPDEKPPIAPKPEVRCLVKKEERQGSTPLYAAVKPNTKRSSWAPPSNTDPKARPLEKDKRYTSWAVPIASLQPYTEVGTQPHKEDAGHYASVSVASADCESTEATRN